MATPYSELLQVELLSHSARIVLLTRIAHLLTVSARGTYEVGTENVIKPQLLRAYNELLHRVTAAIRDHIMETKHRMSFEAVLKQMFDFGVEFSAEDEVTWVVRQAVSMPLPTEH